MEENMPDECPVCKRPSDEVTLRYAADPFQEEINDDDTPVWQCDDCHQESACDI